MRFIRLTMGTALLAAGCLLASVQPASARHIYLYRGGYAMPYRVPGYGIVGYGVGPVLSGYTMPYRVPGYGAYGSSFGYGGYGYGYGAGPGLGYGAGTGGYGAGYGYQQPYSSSITPGYSGGVQQPAYGTNPGYSGGVVQPGYAATPRYTDAVPGDGPASGSSRSLYPPASAPGTPAQGDSAPAPEAAQPEGNQTTARLRVVVPNAEAQLWVNGMQTRQNGIEREFVSPELKPGKSYAYQLRARWRNVDGQTTEQTRTVAIQAGGRQVVDFNREEDPAVATPPPPARTEARTPPADPQPSAREEARPPAPPDDNPAPEAAPRSPAPAQPEGNTLPPTRRFTVPPPTPEGP